MGAMGTGSGLVPLLMLLVVALIAMWGVGMGWMVSQGRRAGYGSLAGNGAPHLALAEAYRSPAELLRERYARGEIDISEFEERISGLLRAPASPSRPLT